MIVTVRILFTFTGGSGHFFPSVPVARAALAQGHEILFSCQEAMLGAVTAAGFRALESGGRTLTAPETRGPLLPADRTHEANVIRDFFAGRIARERADRLITLAADWRADVIVRDEIDFGAAVAAERLGVPHVCVIVLAAGGLIRPGLVAEPLNALRSEHGLPADPHLAMLHRYLTLVPIPPSYRTPEDPLPATARHIQSAALDKRSSADTPDQSTLRTLDWLAARPGRPTIYFTLGTIFHQESGDLFPRILAGLTGLDANIAVTVGHEIDPTELGPQPETVHIERFIPQDALLPHCDAVISHAGSGSVIGSLAFGVPLVLLPIGADQPLNADRCDALRVAKVLDPITADTAAVSAAMTSVLNDPPFRQAARQLQEEASAQPTADTAASWVARLTTDPDPRTA
jgi:UDP:flavonoid glycosyltransferase YjiC (YdhE family)